MVKKSDRAPKIKKRLTTSQRYGELYVPHLEFEQVQDIAEAAFKLGKNSRGKLLGERNKLLIQLLFDGCLRVTEALNITPYHIQQDQYGWRVEIFGKWSRPRKPAISSSLAEKLLDYAKRCKVKKNAKLFPITRARAFQIIDEAMQKAEVQKPDHVGTVHVLRHSGALARLKISNNPIEIQYQLGHKSVKGTFRYFKTLQSEDAMQRQQQIDFEW